MENRFRCFYKKGSRLTLLLFFVTFGCAGFNKTILFYSGNINGTIESCNCPKVADGSILNHITLIKDSIRLSESALKISTGNIFSLDNSEKEDQLVLALFDSLEYDVFVPGNNDLEMLTQMIGKENLTAWNIEGFKPYRTFEKGGFKISVTGMADHEYLKTNNKAKILEKTINQICKYTDSLRTFSDIVIFVSNLNPEFEKRVFNEASAIDIMISGVNQKSEAIEFGDRIYISPGRSPGFTGRLDISKGKKNFEFNNHFIEMDYNKIPEDEESSRLVDSLKIKSGLKLRLESIDSDL